MKKVLSLALMLFVIVMNALAQTEKFCIDSKGRTATIVVDDND